MKGGQADHKRDMQQFTEPRNPEKGYCHACGLPFHRERKGFKVYRCEMCDDYVLCFGCKKRQRHKQHNHMFTKISLIQYLDDFKK